MLTSIWTLLAWGGLIAACAVLLPVCVLALQALAHRFGRDPRAHDGSDLHAPTFVVLMPAHNEGHGVARTVSALLPQLGANGRLLVVADNCSDDTAALAAAAGAQVTVRSDPARRGKGYALDWGVRMLDDAPPDVVIVIDADCEVEAGALGLLAARCVATGCPAQASYSMDLPADPSLKLRIAAFAWQFKARLRAVGQHRLGFPCQLMGTGMAFPWALIREAPLASGNIVEDVQLGVDLAIAGRPPLYCPDAVVRSWFPAADTATDSQRTRWEHGHIAVLATQIPRLISAALRQRQLRLLAVAADLCVPPLALLVLALAGVLGINFAVWVGSGQGGGSLASLTALFLAAIVIAYAWWAVGRQVISLSQLAGVPIYIVHKIPMYLKVLRGKRQAEWVRTDRDGRDR